MASNRHPGGGGAGTAKSSRADRTPWYGAVSRPPLRLPSLT